MINIDTGNPSLCNISRGTCKKLGSKKKVAESSKLFGGLNRYRKNHEEIENFFFFSCIVYYPIIAVQPNISILEKKHTIVRDFYFYTL